MGTKMKKILLLVIALLLLITGTILPAMAAADEAQPNEGDVPADTEEMAQVNETSGGGHLVRSQVVDLGKVPEETRTEEQCEVLLVADVATGVPIHEKNISVRVPIGGAAVQLMTAIVALDYCSLDEAILVTSAHLKDLPKNATRFGLSENNQVYVSDLIVSMLYHGAVDSAYVLRYEILQRSGATDIGTLMAQKADLLGMTDTNYQSCDGTGVDQIITTAADQCELYLDAMSRPELLDLMRQGTYPVQSVALTVDTSNAKGTDMADTKKSDTAKSTDKRAKVNNDNLPSKITNDVSAVVPENRLYDVRLSSAVSCQVASSKEYGRYCAVFFRAVDYRSDMVILYWTSTSSSTVAVRNLYYLTDIFSRRKVVDLIPYVEVAANALKVEKNGVTVSGWFLTEGHEMYGRQMASYDPEAKTQNNKDDFDISKMTVLLKPELSTFTTNDDGSRSVNAKVLVDNSVEGSVLLATAPKATQTEVSQNTNTVYTDDDILPEQPTLMSQYGWIIIIAGVVLLGLLVIILGVALRNRLEH